MSGLTFGEWKLREDPAQVWKEPKGSFAQWHEKEYGGASAPAPPARTDPTLSRQTTSDPVTDSVYKQDAFTGTSGKLPVPEEENAKESKYSILKGIAGGVQKGFADIAQAGGNAVAMYEDIQYAPLEVITGRKIGELSDKGPLNLWNDSIARDAERAEDYYADNIAAGGAGAEFLDKAVRKTILFMPQMLYGALTGGTAAVPELAQEVSRSLPGLAGDIQSMAGKLAKDPRYWLSVAGTTGDRYQETKEKTPADNTGGWLKNVAKSAGEGLYKEAVGTSDVVPDVLSTLAEIAYEMYDERQLEENANEDSWVIELLRYLLT